MELMSHQKITLDRLVNGQDILNFSEAGTGKTLPTLKAYEGCGMQGGLIVAPPIAVPMWEEEIIDKLGASVQIIDTGSTPLRGTDFYVTSYSLASNVDVRSRLVSEFSDREGYYGLTLDESQNLKNPLAARTQAIFGPSCTGRMGLFDFFDQCWSLSGTPILKYADDLWSQLRATQPHMLRKYNVVNEEDFKRKFTFQKLKRPHPKAAPRMMVIDSQNERLLNRMLYKDMGTLRFTMDDVEAEMPELTYRNVYVRPTNPRELSAAEANLDFNDLLEENDNTTKALRILGKCKQDGFIDYWVDEIKGPLLVGYWYNENADELEKKLRQFKNKTIARVRGGMSSTAKEKIRKAFNAGHIDVLLGQIGAMNVSWNLQECGRHVAILEDQFSPGIIEQFIKRIWRIGQEQHVQVDFIKVKCKLDQAVTDVRTKKYKKSGKILDPLKGEPT